MKLRDYAAFMTAAAVANLTVTVQIAMTDNDVLEIALAAVMFAALATAAFEIICALIENDRLENIQMRRARRNRQRRRKEIPVVYTVGDWPMYDEKGRRVKEL